MTCKKILKMYGAKVTGKCVLSSQKKLEINIFNHAPKAGFSTRLLSSPPVRGKLHKREEAIMNSSFKMSIT